MIAFVPAITLAWLWVGVEAMILLGITALIVAYMTRPILPALDQPGRETDHATGLPLREEGAGLMQDMIEEAARSVRSTACLVVGIDDATRLERQLPGAEFDEIMRRTSERLAGALRDSDMVARLEGARFAVMLKPTPHPDLESMIQLSVRLQSATEEPLSIAGRELSITTYAGFCLLKRCPNATGDKMISAAETAAEEAARNGPSAIRAFSPEIRRTAEIRSSLSTDAGEGLENGDIVAYFQPQLSTDTGQVTGMQAVPRWLHRDRGILTEEDILPAVAAAGMRKRFYEVMMYQIFSALRTWQRKGEICGPVSIPVNDELMANPKMAERLQWELDRFDLDPSLIRLILQQNVIGQLKEDIVAHNLASCRKLGCHVELAGFGNGPASVSSIKTANAQRLRIHRSFVTQVDRNPEKQQLVAAIISLAEGMGVATLAEGVTTIGEHSMLAQLGCNHVQGRAISAPMPLDETHEWLKRHQARLAKTPQIDTKRGA
ncbi:GGDEF domain-containing protein [Thioclava sp. SK-1]|uniref:bifunctional diguanylate cyclase/phosphodiesterase n=1 Tax=Thioclava sp. SK-1 TaxID=1889770 RepID=UPI00159F1441|nr:GGDEF domain-containing protein [Thioclava sp. SK-1]